MQHDNVEIAKASYEAFARGDRGTMETLLAPDFHFTSPYDNRIERATYWTRCWPGAGRGNRFDFIHAAPDGDRVFVTYESHNPDGTGGRNTEVLTLHGGMITEAEVYFGWDLPHKAAPGASVEP